MRHSSCYPFQAIFFRFSSEKYLRQLVVHVFGQFLHLNRRMGSIERIEECTGDDIKPNDLEKKCSLHNNRSFTVKRVDANKKNEML